MTPEFDREALARYLESSHPLAANWLRTQRTTFEPAPTPFLRRGSIVRITHHLSPRAVVYTAGYLEPDFAVLLARNPAGYQHLAERAGVDLRTEERRLAYLIVFLETTRSFARRFAILGSVAEIKARPNLKEADAGRLRAVEEEYKPVIVPPRISEEEPWRCTVFVLKAQDLVRMELKLGADGRIQGEQTVLQKDLPVPYTQ